MPKNENGPRSAGEQTGGQEGSQPNNSTAESTTAVGTVEYVSGVRADALCAEAGLEGGLADILGADGLAVLRADYDAVGWSDALVEDTLADLPWVPVAALGKALPDFRPTWKTERAEGGADDPHAARETAARHAADVAVHGSAAAPGMYLPREFWERRGFLRHVRDAAWSRDESPHGVLLAVLALLSAHLDPSVRVETGIKSPLPLNMYAGLVSTSGEGKSSATAAATRMLSITYPDVLAVGAIAPEEVPRTHNLGTGQGVAEMYMGTVREIDPETSKPGPPLRCQVRHKVMFDVDEAGEMLAGMQLRGSTLSSVLRSAWSGNMRGQANASKETYREVTDFTIGIVAGFQREVLARLLTDVERENGTPQRFLFGPVRDPFVPDIEDTPADPGPLRVGPLPIGQVDVCPQLRRAIKEESLKRRRGELGLTQLESQRPAMLARVAALLAILDGRTVVESDDWTLARALFGCSLAVQREAEAWAHELEAEKSEAKNARAVSLAVATAAAVDGRTVTVDRYQARILGYLPAAGVAVAWGGRNGLRKNKFKGAERDLADAALTALVNAGQVAFDGDSVARL